MKSDIVFNRITREQQLILALGLHDLWHDLCQ